MMKISRNSERWPMGSL